MASHCGFSFHFSAYWDKLFIFMLIEHHVSTAWRNDYFVFFVFLSFRLLVLLICRIWLYIVYIIIYYSYYFCGPKCSSLGALGALSVCLLCPFDTFLVSFLGLFVVVVVVLGYFLFCFVYEHVLTFCHHRMLQAHLPIFFCPRSGIYHFFRVSFTGKWDLETKIWQHDMLIAIEVPLLLGLLYLQSLGNVSAFTNSYTSLYFYMHVYIYNSMPVYLLSIYLLKNNVLILMPPIQI